MAGISTHILDLSRGAPATGVLVTLEYRTSDCWTAKGAATTDADGRCRQLLGSSSLEQGTYRLVFETDSYFARHNVNSLYPEVVVTFEVHDPDTHYHIPLLLAANGYTTYRGT